MIRTILLSTALFISSVATAQSDNDIEMACFRALATATPSYGFSTIGGSGLPVTCTVPAIVVNSHPTHPEFTPEQRQWCQARQDKIEADAKAAEEAIRASREAEERRLTEWAKKMIDRAMKK